MAGVWSLIPFVEEDGFLGFLLRKKQNRSLRVLGLGCFFHEGDETQGFWTLKQMNENLMGIVLFFPKTADWIIRHLGLELALGFGV